MVTFSGEARIFILGIAVISPSNLLVSDWTNDKLRLVDCVNGGVLSQVSLSGKPCRLCFLGGGGAAVLLNREKEIKYFRINGDKLSLDRSFEVKKDPVGISAFDSSNLVVSYQNPGRVEMMTINGRVIDAVDNQKAGKQLFQYPNFIVTSTRGDIFVSDCGNCTIIQMDRTLRITRTFTSPMQKQPYGIISVSTDQLLVVDKDSQSIVALNPTNGTVTPLLGQAEGIQLPLAVAWCPTSKKLYVGRAGSQPAVSVFCLK